MLVLLVVPLTVTAYLSVQNLTLGGSPTYAGFANFEFALHDAQFWGALAFTVLYVTVTLPVHTALGLMLALMLERVHARLRGLLLSAYAMPFILTPVVGTLIFSWLFKDYWGLIPYLLARFGIHISWFSESAPARIVIMSWGVWWTVGFNVMVLFAGLQTLPEEQLRAAVVDGATYFQRLRLIILPHLLPFFVLVTLFNVIDGLRVFDSVWVITKGGPGTATETLAYLTYRTAFVLRDLGRGSALSMLSVALTGTCLVPVLYLHFRSTVAAGRSLG